MDIYEHLAEMVKPHGAGVTMPAPRSLIEVRGPDAVEFLHRICSQDVESLGDGDASSACFLDPKGKLIATADLGRTATGLWIDTPRATVESLAAYLDRFHFTERLEIVRPPVDGPDAWTCAESIGFAASASKPDADSPCVEIDADGSVRMSGGRFGLAWIRMHGTRARVEAWVESLGVPTLDPDVAEWLRMASGALVVGADTDDRTIALEAPVDDHISTSKGCYTGQEIVARIHTYGHVNRKLVLLRTTCAATVESEAAHSLHELEDGDAVGRLTSCRFSAQRQEGLAFAYVPRDFAALGTELAVGDANGPRAVVVAFGVTSDPDDAE